MNLSKQPVCSCGLSFALLFLFFAFPKFTNAQQSESVSGKVTDTKGNPIANASVYLSHTSKGVTSSSSGEFNLQNAPEGKYELVISAIGYETKIISISSDSYPINLQISLKQRATEMAEVVIEATDKSGWRKYGEYFTDNFIGKTHNAKYCKIVNPEVIRFRFSEKNNRLTAKSNEPIIIQNDALGYKVSFQLVKFVADFNENTVAYYGYPFFIESEESDKKKWITFFNNRRKAYYGSMMHFMRAVYEDNLKEEHFAVRATISRANLEKIRVKKILETHIASQDSLNYYKKVLKQRDTITRKESLVTLDEMLTKTGSYSKLLFFKNTMEVIYVGENNRRRNRSEITLKTPEAIEILENGSYFSPLELLTFNYWSQHEKICDMLPFDYYPDR
jgi:hypothetical protein